MTYWIWDNLGTCSITEYTIEGIIVIDVRDLKDGHENLGKIKHKLITICGLLAMGHRVVIRCMAGMSRSNALACGVMCLLGGMHWDEGEKLVKSKVPRCTINLDFADSVKNVIKQMRGW